MKAVTKHLTRCAIVASAILFSSPAAIAAEAAAESRLNAALLLGGLGIWALVLAFSNIRDLRYQPIPITPRPRQVTHSNQQTWNNRGLVEIRRRFAESVSRSSIRTQLRFVKGEVVLGGSRHLSDSGA